MSLTGIAPRLTAGERTREPRDLGVVAYFDGYGQGAYPSATPETYPRRLTPSEGASWREGYAEGYRERTCHAAHGFTPCPLAADGPDRAPCRP